MKERINYKAKAFLSCSLREEDRNFVDLVANILKHYQIEPFGTVGKYDASPENPSSLMKQNIENSDIVVIAATQRYLTKDFHDDSESNTLSEMIHTETGMAYALSKPVVVFVEEGTNVGSFIPSITHYVTLDGTQNNLDSQSNIIKGLLNSALQKVDEKKRKAEWDGLGNLVIGGLALYGGLTLLSYNEKENNE